MSSMIEIPGRRLSEKSVKVWMIKEIIENAAGFIVLIALFLADYYFSWPTWAGWLLIGIVILSIAGCIWSIGKAFLLYKHWRYSFTEEFLQLKSGALREEHQLIPMSRIQSVSTHRGPLLKRYHLCSVRVNTMASSHIIPSLNERDAVDLRNKIACYAKTEEAE